MDTDQRFMQAFHSAAATKARVGRCRADLGAYTDAPDGVALEPELAREFAAELLTLAADVLSLDPAPPLVVNMMVPKIKSHAVLLARVNAGGEG